eukprot:g9753.t1
MTIDLGEPMTVLGVQIQRRAAIDPQNNNEYVSIVRVSTSLDEPIQPPVNLGAGSYGNLLRPGSTRTSRTKTLAERKGLNESSFLEEFSALRMNETTESFLEKAGVEAAAAGVKDITKVHNDGTRLMAAPYQEGGMETPMFWMGYDMDAQGWADVRFRDSVVARYVKIMTVECNNHCSMRARVRVLDRPGCFTEKYMMVSEEGWKKMYGNRNMWNQWKIFGLEGGASVGDYLMGKDPDTGKPWPRRQATSKYACQQQCAKTKGCEYFTFFPGQAWYTIPDGVSLPDGVQSKNLCYMQNRDAVPMPLHGRINVPSKILNFPAKTGIESLIDMIRGHSVVGTKFCRSGRPGALNVQASDLARRVIAIMKILLNLAQRRAVFTAGGLFIESRSNTYCLQGTSEAMLLGSVLLVPLMRALKRFLARIYHEEEALRPVEEIRKAGNQLRDEIQQVDRIYDDETYSIDDVDSKHLNPTAAAERNGRSRTKNVFRLPGRTPLSESEETHTTRFISDAHTVVDDTEISIPTNDEATSDGRLREAVREVQNAVETFVQTAEVFLAVDKCDAMFVAADDQTAADRIRAAEKHLAGALQLFGRPVKMSRGIKLFGHAKKVKNLHPGTPVWSGSSKCDGDAIPASHRKAVRDLTGGSSASPASTCFKWNQRYVGGNQESAFGSLADGVGYVAGTDTVAVFGVPSLEHCQLRCASTPFCYYFTYNREGVLQYCHMQTYDAVLATPRVGVGSWVVPRPEGETAGGRICRKELTQLEHGEDPFERVGEKETKDAPGEKCDSDDPKEDSNFLLAKWYI